MTRVTEVIWISRRVSSIIGLIIKMIGTSHFGKKEIRALSDTSEDKDKKLGATPSIRSSHSFSVLANVLVISSLFFDSLLIFSF